MECHIGWVAEQVDGSFAGSIRTLTIRDQIVLRPAAGEPRGAAVNYDALIGSGARMGAARVDAQGIVVELRSPELPAAITATLEPAGAPREWLLVWRSP